MTAMNLFILVGFMVYLPTALNGATLKDSVITNDPYQWLEDRNGTTAVAWAQGESAFTKTLFEKDPRFKTTTQEILKILTSTDKIAMVSLFEGNAYNLWQDENHKRGLWRRTTTTNYKSSTPDWEILIDFDELAKKENKPWVFKGVSFLPGSDRCLVSLSQNNQDAIEIREFSLTEKDFVKDGFFISESKSHADWIDENHLLITPALNEDQVTNSGYPRNAYHWSRGQKIEDAVLVYEGQKQDVYIWAAVFRDHGKVLPMVGRAVTFHSMESFALTPDLRVEKLPLPQETATLNFFKGKIFFSVRKPWKGFPAGSLLAVSQKVIGDKDIPADQIQMLYQPEIHSSFDYVVPAHDRLYVGINENVHEQVYEAELDGNGVWRLKKVFNSANSFSVAAVDQYRDAIIFQEEGDLQPRRLILKEGNSQTEVKKAKSHFNESHFLTEQFWVKSKDGVEIPYTVIRSKNLKYDGKNPTLLYGYGGFAVPLTPSYHAVLGKAWLEKGGVYVRANIRGGGEFGPAWHQAAMKENKQKSYDDFIAIAEDLIARKITSPKYLGIQGGSNGGLLVGAVTMQRPELFNAVLCQIPLLDMIRYTHLPPGASWADEYGDPADPKWEQVILKYSPYQNISMDKKYPKIYFQTTQADDRVHPGHARKMAARMKEYGHDVLFLEALDGGHGGGGVVLEDQARLSAYNYIYLYQQLLQ